MSIENDHEDLIDSVVLPVGREEEIKKEAERTGEDPDVAVRRAKETSQAAAKRNIDEGEKAVQGAEEHAREVFDETEEK